MRTPLAELIALDGLLAGRSALVTGSARGIGFATAVRFCEEGAAVALSDLDAAEARKGAAELTRQGHVAIAVPFDVTNEDAVDNGFTEAEERLGGLDVLVANAGILHMGPLVEEKAEAFRRVVDVNLIGVFLCFRAAACRFREQGRGVILATASQAGLHGYAHLGAYCASKFGVVSLVETLAKELGAHGVRVNCVAPGLIQTAMHEVHVAGMAAREGYALQGARERYYGEVPLGRAGTAAEVASVLAFLASDLASYVTGATVRVTGGDTG